MRNVYFDEKAFEYVMKPFEVDPFLSESRFKEYLEKYPKDYYARAYYVLLLTRICKFDEALEEYNRINEEVDRDTYYAYSNKKRISAFEFNMTLASIKLLSSQENYEELYGLLQEVYDKLHMDDKVYVSYFCEAKMGTITTDGTNPNAYRFNQSVKYQEEAFYEHIKRHMADYNVDEEKPNIAVFRADFPLNEVIEEVKKSLLSDQRTFNGFFEDTYCFKYDHCGTVNNSTTDYFKVICQHNTSNMITMFPAVKCKSLPIIDLNYLRESKETGNVKIISSLERFKLRYGKGK